MLYIKRVVGKGNLKMRSCNMIRVQEQGFMNKIFLKMAQSGIIDRWLYAHPRHAGSALFRMKPWLLAQCLRHTPKGSR